MEAQGRGRQALGVEPIAWLGAQVGRAQEGSRVGTIQLPSLVWPGLWGISTRHPVLTMGEVHTHSLYSIIGSRTN